MCWGTTGSHLTGTKGLVKWIQSLESGRVECALDYLIISNAHEQFSRFFTDGPMDVQVGYLDTAEVVFLVIADLPNYLSSCWSA